ncbi:MAG: glutamine-hydrolyzing GMP synthase [Gammaproteobacteria bacterium]|jgi:GMP synthase (glutamine-hydrolysing)|nr:glutamine-hydrolyzing GMP synthase [Gammaproteobacteria bacterium]MDP7455659.1 glutamine-hydrolyzing GMP synthase [Gammaproteobacteria bacterium]|tara:strand:- start:181 stop:1761 length:1581 start_codon:yes stop_codon:yes gene_type:complete
MTTANIHSQKILILDFGSQYTQLIARRVRELGVYCEIWDYDCEQKLVAEFAPQGIIFSGGPETATLAESPQAAEFLFELGTPILGICYGMHTMAEQLGGKVEASSKSEFGYARVEVSNDNDLLRDIEDHISESGKAQLDVWMSHGDKVVQLPAGFRVIAATESAPIAAMSDESKKLYGIQFHPEVTHTLQGLRILERFIHEICECDSLWNPASIIEDAIGTVRETVGADQVLLGLSGGVDSSVVAALLHKAIGDQLTCVFVDNGLLRLNEGDQVMATFANNMGLKVIRANTQEQFLSRLKGIDDPEQKRKVIGNTFIEVFDAEASKIDGVKWLAQGTIYPDVIESAGSKTGKAHVIKSHHNVGGLPEDMELKLVEPLRELFKDEVRKIGLELGLPHDMVYRHPFPGPGLGVRVLGEVKKEYCDVLRQADAIFMEELHRADCYNKVSQAFAVFLPVKSVGVVGDARRYTWVITLRAVETIDFMTARWARLDPELLEIISNRIMNEIADVSRVAYDISSKPPATIEWE